MWTHLGRFLGLVGIVVFSSMPLSAQPTADELTVRPGDTITWTVSPPHQLRFGGSVTHSGAPLALTPFATVQTILDLNPAMTPGTDGIALGPTGAGAKVTATVKSSAAAGSEFFFTCGFGPHNNLMVTVPLKIAAASGPPRQIEIMSAMPPRWVLKTATGDKNLNR
jgi:hypothetical protein